MRSSLPQSPACASKPLLWPAPLFPRLLLSFESINYIVSGAAGLDAQITRVFLFLTFCFFQSRRMSRHQKNLNEERQQQEAEVTEANPEYHCHGYSWAYENRKREQRQARRKLCVASVICIFFMIAEITGEYVCSKRAQFGAQHSCIHALLHLLWVQWPMADRGEPTWDKITLLSPQSLKELWFLFCFFLKVKLSKYFHIFI